MTFTAKDPDTGQFLWAVPDRYGNFEFNTGTEEEVKAFWEEEKNHYPITCYQFSAPTKYIPVKYLNRINGMRKRYEITMYETEIVSLVKGLFTPNKWFSPDRHDPKKLRE